MTKQQRFFNLLHAARAYVEALSDWMRACDQIIKRPDMPTWEKNHLRRQMTSASHAIDLMNDTIRQNVSDDVRLRDYTSFLGALDKLADERSRKG